MVSKKGCLTIAEAYHWVKLTSLYPISIRIRIFRIILLHCVNDQRDVCTIVPIVPNCVIQYTVCLQMNGAVSKVNKNFISHLTRAQLTPSAAETVQVSHALPAVRFSCLLRGCGASFQDDAAAGKGFLCAPF